MHKQDLKNLLNFHRDLTLDKFCEEVFPDFPSKESGGYLNRKFKSFQNHFIAFLSELDEQHLEKLAIAVSNRTRENGNGH